jgi:hypothetical protein
MYEIGIAHTLGKPVILITQFMDAIPFDLRAVRHIHYEYSPRGCKQLEECLAQSIEAAFGEYRKLKSNENHPSLRCMRATDLPPRFEE